MPININATDLATVVRFEPVAQIDRGDFKPTVKAAVHDALWMLTQQWRVGEFKGDDAGTLVKAKLETQSTLINRFQSTNKDLPSSPPHYAEPFDINTPLEAKIEKQPIRFDLGMQLEIGLQWYKILKKNEIESAYEVFATTYTIETDFSTTPNYFPDKQSNTNAMQMRLSLNEKVMNGQTFINYLNGGGHAKDISNFDNTTKAKLDIAETQFIGWYNSLYYQPQGIADNSWSDRQLEYQFKLSLPLTSSSSANQTVLTAEKYDNGKVDWYCVDVDPNLNRLPESPNSTINNNDAISTPITLSYVPTPITFKGMPNERWWEFEDKNFGIFKLANEKQDISKLMLTEFGLTYSNDWFTIPHNVQVGSVTQVNYLRVTDVFGRIFVIKPAGTGQDDDWQRWAMYNINKKGITDDMSYDKLLILPTLANRMESDPIEKVMFLRDEMANMVWGVEEIVPNELFGGMEGKQAVLQLSDYLNEKYRQDEDGDKPNGYVKNNAQFKYKLLMNNVPENWIPFIATKISPTASLEHRNVLLQRAALLRYFEDRDTTERIRPRTDILSKGLENPNDLKPYFINEEEVSRSGFIVSAAFERTRWYSGQTYTWVSRKVSSGRGEANSGFINDVVLPKKPYETLTE